MSVRAVFLDVGETLIDETRLWGEWADWLGVPRLTFMGVLGALVDRDLPHEEVFQVFRPGFDLDRERAARIALGNPPRLDSADVYPDVSPTLERLRGQGYIVGVAGNQPATAEASLTGLALPVDFVTTSETLGVQKPSIEFFERLAALASVQPSQAAYVGDRLDNDVLPAKRAGMVAVFIRRGLWGFLHATRPEAELADARIESLVELPDLLRVL